MFRPLFIAVALSLAAGASAQPSYELTDEGFVATEVPEPGTPAAELADARRLIAQDEPKQAEKQLKAWLKAHPNHPLRVEALLLRGDAQLMAGDYYKSLFDYEAIATYYPATEQFNVALRREFEVATRFTQGVKRKLWGRRLLAADADGAELLIRIQERVPGSELGERASLALSDYYFHDGQMELAAEAYDLFLINYPRSDRRSFAMLRGIQASLAQFNGPEFDATGLIDAQERLRQFANEFPCGGRAGGGGGPAGAHPRIAGPARLLQCRLVRPHGAGGGGRGAVPPAPAGVPPTPRPAMTPRSGCGNWASRSRPSAGRPVRPIRPRRTAPRPPPGTGREIRAFPEDPRPEIERSPGSGPSPGRSGPPSWRGC